MSPDPVNTTLEHALRKCQSAAKTGYNIAKANLDQTANETRKISEKVAQLAAHLDKSQLRIHDAQVQLKSQLAALSNQIGNLHINLQKELEERRARLKNFSVTLFGRTMAGKSTLMEILTRGNGQSIGKGAQRTTRNVRDYYWEGLRITDVPGVAAFEGAKDEKLALASAAQADLVLFLITDDAPQAIEAEWLARVRSLGKPILGICNVKFSVDDDDDLKYFLSKQKRIFDKKRLNEIISQFHSFADKYSIGSKVPFLFTHLRSRFLALQPEYSKVKNELVIASNFCLIENEIIKQVVEKGRFFRLKSFIDGAVVPMLEISTLLFSFGSENSRRVNIFKSKKNQLEEWSNGFRADSERRIKSLVNSIGGELRNQIGRFSEDHYSDPNAGRKWKKEVESLNIASKVDKLQKELRKVCNEELSEISRQLQSEISLFSRMQEEDREFSIKGIFDSKRIFNWTITALTGGLGIAAVVFGSTPIGLAAAGIAAGLGLVGTALSFLFEDRATKIERARQDLAEKLNKDVSKIETNLTHQLTACLEQELERTGGFIEDLGTVSLTIALTASAQSDVARTLNRWQKKMVLSLMRHALSQLNTGNLVYIKGVSRVPGSATTVLIEPKKEIPRDIRNGLETLFGENLLFVIDANDPKDIIRQLLEPECRGPDISVDYNIGVAYIPLRNYTVKTKIRILLAQQLTELQIIEATS